MKIPRDAIKLILALGILALVSYGAYLAAKAENSVQKYSHPIRVVGAPIEPEHPLWRRYMERHAQNLPFQYHNGGIWPFVGGFWVLLLARQGRPEEARAELARLADLNRINGWEFNEWFHGRTGAPMGMPGQSWNAALFLLAEASLDRGISIFD